MPTGLLSGLATVLSGGAAAGSPAGHGGVWSAWGPAGQLAAQLLSPAGGELIMPGYWRVG